MLDYAQVGNSGHWCSLVAKRAKQYQLICAGSTTHLCKQRCDSAVGGELLAEKKILQRVVGVAIMVDPDIRAGGSGNGRMFARVMCPND